MFVLFFFFLSVQTNVCQSRRKEKLFKLNQKLAWTLEFGSKEVKRLVNYAMA